MNTESTLASQLYRQSLNQASVTQPEDSLEQSISFSDALEAAASDMLNTVQKGEATSGAAMAGEADVQTVVEALVAAEMALQTAVVFRDRLVEAYQEILRMPV